MLPGQKAHQTVHFFAYPKLVEDSRSRNCVNFSYFRIARVRNVPRRKIPAYCLSSKFPMEVCTKLCMVSCLQLMSKLDFFMDADGRPSQKHAIMCLKNRVPRE